MAALAGVLFFWILLGIGLSAVVLGIFGIVTRRRRKKITAIVSIVILVIGILITAVPAGFFTFIIYQNIMPPDDYVKTEIAIEETGYQAERFTADGIAYEVLDLNANYYICKDLATPIFSYRVPGILAGASRGNYYMIDNQQNFNLIWDGNNRFFCPVKEKSKIQQYYDNEESWQWFYHDLEKDTDVPLQPDAEQIMNRFLSYNITGMDEMEVVSEETKEKIYISQTSSDGIVTVDSYTFIFSDESVCLVNSESHDGKMNTYLVVPLPDEMKVIFQEKNSL